MPYNTFGKFIPSYRKGQFGQSSTNGRRATDKAKLARRSTDAQASVSPFLNREQKHALFGSLYGLDGPTLKPQVAASGSRPIRRVEPKHVYSPEGRYQKDETTFGPGDIVEWILSSNKGKRFLVLGPLVNEVIERGDLRYDKTGIDSVRITDGHATWTVKPTSLTPVGWLKR